MKAIDLDTAKLLTTAKEGSATVAKLDLPIVDDRQSAHLKLTGVVKDGSYKVANGDLVFERALHGLRNTVLLPAGWEVSAVSQSGTIGTYQGRAFVALINLNAENAYKVTIHARQGAGALATPRGGSAGTTGSMRQSGLSSAIALWTQGKPAFGIYAPNENAGPRGQGPRGWTL